jgi:hypothetical protein
LKLFTGCSGWDLELFVEGTAVFFQRAAIADGVISFAVFPAGEIDADQPVGQDAAGLVMLVLVPLFLLLVVAAGPRRLFGGAVGVFAERLSAEFGTAVAHVSYFVVAALDHDRGQVVELRHLIGALEVVAVGAKGDQ